MSMRESPDKPRGRHRWNVEDQMGSLRLQWRRSRGRKMPEDLLGGALVDAVTHAETLHRLPERVEMQDPAQAVLALDAGPPKWRARLPPSRGDDECDSLGGHGGPPSTPSAAASLSR